MKYWWILAIIQVLFTILRKGKSMLDGKEVEGKLGDKGSYSVDVDDKGMVRVELAAGDGATKGGAFIETDVVVLLEAAAKHTSNTVDDSVVAMIKAKLNR